MSTKTSLCYLAYVPLFVSTIFGTNNVIAADRSLGDTESLGTLVVVGEPTNTEVTPEQLERQQANDLADVFRQIPSVDVGGSLGIVQKVYVRGLEDTYLNVTVDGAPQTGTLFHHIGRVSVEPELLKEVRVQAGAGEATSGAGAIGGAIRFKTKNASDLLEEGKSFGGLVKGSSFSNDGNKASISLFGRVHNDIGILASYVDSSNKGFKDGNGDQLLGTEADQKLGFLKIGGAFADNQTFSASVENREESGKFRKQPNWHYLDGDELYDSEGSRETVVLNHTISINDLLNLETTLYTTEQEFGRDLYDYNSNVSTEGLDIRNTSRLGNHSVTYGIDYRSDEVKGFYDVGSTYYPDETEEKGSVSGFYAQDHWQLTDDLLASFGLRYDKYELNQVTAENKLDSDGVSPNLGFRYSLNDEIEISLGYAEAMRGKEVSDGFVLENVGATPELKPEEVENTELAIEYENGYLGLKAAVYRTKIDNVIHNDIYNKTYSNVGELKTDGFELNAAYQFDKLYLAANFSHNETKLEGNLINGYEHLGLGNSRGDTLKLEASYELSEEFNLAWLTSYTDALNDLEVLFIDVRDDYAAQTYTIDKPSYVVHDIYLTYEPKQIKNLKVNFGAQNLFDKQYRDHSSVGNYTEIPYYSTVAGIYERGRDVRVSLSYQF